MILVTAANGRTGRSVVRALSRAGHAVRAFDLAAGVEGLLGQGAAEAITGDMLEPADLPGDCGAVGRSSISVPRWTPAKPRWVTAS